MSNFDYMCKNKTKPQNQPTNQKKIPTTPKPKQQLPSPPRKEINKIPTMPTNQKTLPNENKKLTVDHLVLSTPEVPVDVDLTMESQADFSWILK